MKHRILLAWALAIALLSVLHVWLNVGWERFGKDLRRMITNERQELQVGFLPVT